jgi:tetratricopeptide (TPR) repeat protein
VAPKRIKFVFIAVLSLTWSLSTLARTQFWKTPMALYQEDLKSDPTSFYLNNNVGLELITARKFQEAIPYLEKTIAVSPEKSTEWLIGYRNLGAAYYELGNLPKAEECFRTAFADPDVRSYRAMVMVLAAQGKHDEAKAYQVEGLKRYPGDAVLLRYQK